MSIPINESERNTQNRIIKFFQNKLGYEHMGNWETREGNSNIEEEYLKEFLNDHGYSQEAIKKAIEKLKKAAENQQKSLYDRNKEIYEMLRYGVDIKTSPSEHSIHVHFIDWDNPEQNHFAIAEEVTIRGKHIKRPDIVIYINGIAIGVLELKRSSISITEGIRQNLDNQKADFIRDFFTTIQLVMAGNNTQGLKYGTIETPERYYQEWQEENPEFDHNKKSVIPRTLPRNNCENANNILDCDIYRILNKNRLIELLHDFIIFDSGIKKISRHNQYFAVKAAQESIKQREGGIIWHTQGSGKSLIMVWLAKWIIENIDDSRVLIITDRIELDEQIESVFKGVDEHILRTKSARDLVAELNRKDENLICSLVHKFGRIEQGKDNYDNYIEQINQNLPQDFEPKGNIFVFVDECHRTQSGKLHKAMKQLLPNAVFIGFTGTPLLKKDKPTTLQTFGKYIHTYKFDEGVIDGVILDLRYEARDVDIKITAENKIDQWFDIKTKGLSDFAKSQLKQRWGTLKKLYSSRDRMEKIVADIIFDFETKPRLATGRGNAMLVAGSIYEACKYYEIFKTKGFDKVAIVTSYRPVISNIKGEATGEEGEAENIKKFEIYRKMIANYYDISENEAIRNDRIERFEEEVKKKFVEEPGQMKLLIVVDKLLTGFDAPSATYLYIDKKMQDHGLFQAICRVNRLDDKDKGDEFDKDYGYIVDYRDLFNSMENAIHDYTSGAFAGFDSDDVKGLLKDRLIEAKKKLDDTIEKLELLVEGVQPPKGVNQYREYFVGDDSEDKQQLRLEFYKYVSTLVRAYTNIANELDEAGYSEKEQEEIKEKVKQFTEIRDQVKLMSSDYLDLKVFDPAMRYLIDSYINAEESKVLANFENTSLLEIIAIKGLKQAIKELPEAIGKDKEALAETIEGNIRKLIIEKRDVNPVYYNKMSAILKDLIKQRKEEVIQYEDYLKEIENLTKKITQYESIDDTHYPPSIKQSPAKKALYDNLNGLVNREEIANKIDEKIRMTKKADWRGNKIKEREVANAILQVLDEYADKNYDTAKIATNESKDEYLSNKINLEDIKNKLFDIVYKQEEY